MKNLSGALKDVSDWETLGVRLGVRMPRIREISVKRNRDPHFCKMDLLDHWLTTDLAVSWEKVAIALDEMDFQKIAEEIRTVYCSSGRANMLYF